MQKIIRASLIIISIMALYGGCNMNSENRIGDDSFLKFESELVKLQTDASKQKLADDFINSAKNNYPIFEDDTTVVFLYQGEADTVEILGDMGNWVDRFQFKNIEGTNLKFIRANYEEDARLEYWFTYGANSFPSVDHLNPYKVLNGFGEISELAMPKYKRHPIFDEYIHGKIGDLNPLQEKVLSSNFLDYDHKVHIYIPPNYTDDEKYSVVYFQDGADYVEFALAPVILDSLIKQKKIDPLIAVFVTPPNRHQPKVPNRMTEYGLNDNYVKFFTQELVGYIDTHYSTKPNNASRLVVGDSYGGLISTYIAFQHPEIFKNAYSQSGYHSFQADKLINLIKLENKKELNLYVDTGTYERMVGGSFLPKDEIDFYRANQRLNKVLTDKGYNFIYKEYYEGHTWGNWRRHLIDGLIHFYGKGK